jgi:hypothetical protein
VEGILVLHNTLARRATLAVARHGRVSHGYLGFGNWLGLFGYTTWLVVELMGWMRVYL